MTDAVECILSGKKKDIGNDFFVNRLLPSIAKRSVGPFVFWDHIGPNQMTPSFKMEVRAHPHIGLSTLTYLFAGEALHRDSLGYEQVIRPGDVNWMTAGRGIAHSERAEYNSAIKEFAGIQLWVALPKELEEIEPSFQHVSFKELPQVAMTERQTLTLIAGQYGGKSSPVNTYSPMFYLEGRFSETFHLSLPMRDDFESAIYVVSGSVSLDDQVFESGQMIVFKLGAHRDVKVGAQTHLLIFGGEAFPEPRYLWWNFVSTSKDRIEKAKEDWKNKRFAKVINETDFIPLPER